MRCSACNESFDGQPVRAVWRPYCSQGAKYAEITGGAGAFGSTSRMNHSILLALRIVQSGCREPFALIGLTGPSRPALLLAPLQIGTKFFRKPLRTLFRRSDMGGFLGL